MKAANETLFRAEILFSVGIEDKHTGERSCLKIWAENEHQATASIRDLVCFGGCYRWTGTGPMHNDSGEIITRKLHKE